MDAAGPRSRADAVGSERPADAAHRAGGAQQGRGPGILGAAAATVNPTWIERTKER